MNSNLRSEDLMYFPIVKITMTLAKSIHHSPVFAVVFWGIIKIPQRVLVKIKRERIFGQVHYKPLNVLQLSELLLLLLLLLLTMLFHLL